MSTELTKEDGVPEHDGPATTGSRCPFIGCELEAFDSFDEFELDAPDGSEEFELAASDGFDEFELAASDGFDLKSHSWMTIPLDQFFFISRFALSMAKIHILKLLFPSFCLDA